MMVIAADRGGSLRESVAVARAYAESKEHSDSEFMRALLSTPPAPAAKGPAKREDVHDAATAGLRAAVTILERAVTEDELIEYKRFVFSLAETVAKAHKEGGFLGIGANQSEISEAEQAALDEIAAIFDEPPPVA
jgi:hypothetical protein